MYVAGGGQTAGEAYDNPIGLTNGFSARGIAMGPLRGDWQVWQSGRSWTVMIVKGQCVSHFFVRICADNGRIKREFSRSTRLILKEDYRRF